MRRQSFESLNMNGADLSHQNFSRTTFESCNLNGADFTGSNLAGAVFESCNLNRATLPSSALTVARFESCNMMGVRYVRDAPVPVAPKASEPKVWRTRPSQGAARPAAPTADQD